MKSITTKSRYRSKVSRIINRIIHLLDDENIHRKIEAPVDRVLEQYPIDLAKPFSTAYFHEVLADFVRQVSRSAKPVKQNLTVPEAAAEAMRLLDRYEGQGSFGYEAALYDATDDEDKGLQWVVAQMAEIIKKEERQKHVEYVLSRHVDPHDWRLKCAVVEVLMEVLRPYMPASVVDRPVDSLADNWRGLLMVFIDVQKVSRHLDGKQKILQRL